MIGRFRYLSLTLIGICFLGGLYASSQTVGRIEITVTHSGQPTDAWVRVFKANKIIDAFYTDVNAPYRRALMSSALSTAQDIRLCRCCAPCK